MSFSVVDFKKQMSNDGARPNLFEVSLNHSASEFFSVDDNDKFMIRATSIPGATIGAVTVPYFGREVKFAGNRTFGDVTLTIINDEDLGVREAFEYWMEALSANEGNDRVLASRNGSGAPKYFATTTIKPLSKFDEKPVASYTLENSFPTDLSEITLDWGDNDSIAEFTVTMAYDFYQVTTGTSASAGTLSLQL